MRPSPENKRRKVYDGKSGDELSEKHVEAAIEENTGQAQILGCRGDVS